MDTARAVARPVRRATSAALDGARFRELHAMRAEEWLPRARSWVLGDPGVASRLGPYVLLVHSSESNPEKHLLPQLDNVRTYGGFPVQGPGSAVGEYRGVEIWILHHYMGCTATQMWMSVLAGTRVRYVIGLAEMTGYVDHAAVGDIVLPTVAVRGDLITDFHAPPNVPAVADSELLARLEARLQPSAWPVHAGAVYSGMPGGIGVHNPILREKVWRHLQAGLLGNAIETSVTYIEAMQLGISAAEAWVIGDDIAYGRMEHAPDGESRWTTAWGLIARAGLDVLADIAESRPA